MTYRGHIKAGGIVLEQPIDLPEGTQVEVSPIEADIEPRSTTWGEVFKEVIGAAKDLPSDLAQNHDHYIHGTPKR
jgi:hypothetical protein